MHFHDSQALSQFGIDIFHQKVSIYIILFSLDWDIYLCSLNKSQNHLSYPPEIWKDIHTIFTIKCKIGLSEKLDYNARDLWKLHTSERRKQNVTGTHHKAGMC